MFCHFLKLCCRISSNTKEICSNIESEEREKRGLKPKNKLCPLKGNLSFISRKIN